MIIALPHRSLVRFGKDDAAPFLNDLITASIPESAEDGLRPAALLTPQGRILFDMLVSRDSSDILVELDRDRTDLFMKKMMMYRLRRDVSITADDRTVHAVITPEDSAGMTRDTRFTQDVFRLYGDAAASENVQAYTAYRYQHGVAEGASELPPEKALPLEARLDLNQGISFEKGCYIGQEVTARTRYRGLVKRSYLPITLPASISAPQDIMASGKVVGELLGTAQDGEDAIGLASIRLDALDGDNPLTIDGHVITPQFPERLMPLPKRKSD